jgi:hypothetical protein
MKPCPLCAELNFDDAVHCKWCNASLSETPDLKIPAGPEGSSGKATASLICGIFFFFWPVAVAAIILGHIARGEIRRSGGRLKGAGTAMAGLILGYAGVAIIPVILIIAAIAIPSLLQTKIISNEVSAVGALRSLNTACLVYATTYGHFPEELKQLRSEGEATPEHADLIDTALANGQKAGYLFFYRAAPKPGSQEIVGYILNADPLFASAKGQKHYFTDETGVIRVETGKPATAESPPI